jgi:hypothetical protein
LSVGERDHRWRRPLAALLLAVVIAGAELYTIAVSAETSGGDTAALVSCTACHD